MKIKIGGKNGMHGSATIAGIAKIVLGLVVLAIIIGFMVISDNRGETIRDLTKENNTLACKNNLRKIYEAKLLLAIEGGLALTNGFSKAQLFGPVGEEPRCPTTGKTYSLGFTLGDRSRCGELGHNIDP